MARKDKLDKIIEHLVNKQFEIAGYEVTIDDVLGVEGWVYEYFITCEQSLEFRKYAYKYLKKKLYLNKHRTESEISWFCLGYSLTLSDPENFKLIFDYQT